MATTRLVPWAMLVALGLLGCAGARTPVSLGPGSSGNILQTIGGHYDRTPVVAVDGQQLVLPMERVQLHLDGELNGELMFPREANAFGQLLTTDIDDLVLTKHIHLLNVSRSPSGNIVVEMEVEHPFPAPNLQGVVGPLNRADLHLNHLRAIMFMDGTKSFTIGAENVIVNTGTLVNADGYTDQLPPPTGASLTSNKFPYVVFGTENPQQLDAGNYHVTASGGLGWNFVPPGDTRNLIAEPLGFNVFRQGGVSRGTFEFRMNPGDSIDLDFLLVVNYAPAARSKAQRLQPEYFLPANAPQEAWRVTVAKTAGKLESGPSPGSPQFATTATYAVDVYDWQHGHSADVISDFPRSSFRVGLARASDIQSVKVQIPDLILGTLNFPIPPILPENAPAYGAPQTYQFTIDNTAFEKPEGTYYGLVEVVDSRIPDPDFTTLTDSKSVFGVNASTLEFRTLPAFRTYQVFALTVGEGNQAPTAAAVATSSTSILQGQTVSFSTSATDPNGDPLTYEWDFDGDGIFGHQVKDNFTGLPTAPVHTYLGSGPFSVNLRVSDGRGGVDTLDIAGVAPFVQIPVTVTAQNIPPVACFTIVTPTDYLLPGALVTFDGTCSFDTSVPLIFEWDLDGDGNYGDAPHPSSPNPPFVVTALLATPGKHKISLRVREASTPQLYSHDAPYQDVRIRGLPFSLNNPTNGSPRYFGRGLAVGDLNNDSLDDLVVAATGFHSVPTEETGGRVYIFYNKGTDPPFLATPDVIITAAHSGGKNGYGWDLDIGDVNGDGYKDIAVGEFQALSFEGYAEIILSGGASAAPLYYRPNGTAGRPTSVIPIANPTPESGSESYGNAVDIIDLDGDGFDDVVVGAYAASRPGGHWQAGECYAYHSDGVGLTLIATLQKSPYYTADYLGTSIVAGDFDGDGDFDVVGGAPGTKLSGITGVGQIAYWENKRGEPGITDPYFFGGDATNTKITQTYLGNPPNIIGDGSFGRVLKAHDLTGDGAWELFVGAPGYSVGNDPLKSGRIFVYQGGPGMSTSLPAPIHQLRSASPKFRAYFGSSIAIGEASEDGFLDIAVGSPFRDETSVTIETGYVELFHGLGNTFQTTSTIVTPATQPYRGEAGYSVGMGQFYLAEGALEVVYGAPRQTVYPTGPGRITITRSPY